MHFTRFCLDNTTGINKVTQVMNLGPGEQFMSYSEKGSVCEKITQVL